MIIDEFMSYYENDISKVTNALAETNNPKWIYSFMVRILEGSFLSLKEGNKDALKDVVILNIPYLKDILLNINDASYIYKYKKYITRYFNKLKFILNDIDNSYLNDIYKLMDELVNENLDDKIIGTKKLKYIYKYSSFKNIDTSKFQNEIINSRHPKYIYLFAHNKGADIRKLEEEIIDIGNAKYIYLFAKEIKGADTKLLEEAIIESNSPKYIYLFAKEIKYANVRKLQSAILETLDVTYICEFAKNIECDLERFEEDAMYSSSAKYIYELAKVKSIKTINIRKLTQAIKRTANAKYLYLFAKDIKNVNIRTLETSLAKTCNPEYIYLFALNIPSADIPYLERMLFRSGDVNWIYKFFMDIDASDPFYAVVELAKYDLDPDNIYTPNLIMRGLKKMTDELTLENYIRLGRKYNYISRLIEAYRNSRVNDLYVSNLIENYYLEEEQYFMDDPKVKIMTPLKNSH